MQVLLTPSNLSLQAEPDLQRNEKIFSLSTLSPIYSWRKIKQLNKNHLFCIIMTPPAMVHLGLPGYALYSATKSNVTLFCRNTEMGIHCKAWNWPSLNHCDSQQNSFTLPAVRPHFQVKRLKKLHAVFFRD